LTSTFWHDYGTWIFWGVTSIATIIGTIIHVSRK